MSKSFGKTCICCGSKELKEIFKLENGPKYAQKLLAETDKKDHTKVTIPLNQCQQCKMVQVNPEGIDDSDYFEDYLMSRSCTELYTEYDNRLAKEFTSKYSLSGKHIIEIGPGDGYFAEEMTKYGARVSAIEPSETAHDMTIKRNITCYNTFLNDQIINHTTEMYDAFVTKQVMDLVKDPNNFLKNLGRILKPGAYGLIDVPSWTKTLLDRRYYDILPDRFGYYTADTLTKIMERNHFHVIEVFHGADDEYVGAYVVYEGRENGLFLDFKDDYITFNKKFTSLIDEFTAAGKKIAAWGAGAKGVTIFSFANMNSEKIAYVIDKDPYKWNHYLPGSLLKVVSPDYLKENSVDVMLITGVMFYKEITKELFQKYNFNGDIVLISPMPRILGRDELNAIIQ